MLQYIFFDVVVHVFWCWCYTTYFYDVVVFIFLYCTCEQVVLGTRDWGAMGNGTHWGNRARWRTGCRGGTGCSGGTGRESSVGNGNKSALRNRVRSATRKRDAVEEWDMMGKRYLGGWDVRMDAAYFLFFVWCGWEPQRLDVLLASDVRALATL